MSYNCKNNLHYCFESFDEITLASTLPMIIFNYVHVPSPDCTFIKNNANFNLRRQYMEFDITYFYISPKILNVRI